MSYQAITDIIVSPNLQQLQQSSAVNDSTKNLPLNSFSDFLASFQKEESVKSEKIEQPAKAEQKSESVLSQKNEKTDDVQSKREIDDSKAEQSETNKSEEKSLDNGSQKQVSEKVSKNENDSENGENIVQNEKKSEKSAKKLTKKDFSRFEELTEKSNSLENAENAAENLKQAASFANAKNREIKIEQKDDSENLEVSVIDFDGKSSDFAKQDLLNAYNSFENQNEQKDFDFSGKNEALKKQFALDKDGKITVTDLRTENDDSKISFSQQLADKKSAIKTSEIKLIGENTAVMSVELNPNAQADVLSLNTQTAASNGSNFQAMLSNQLNNVAPEFVKAGNLILKDNNQGTINLVLHPDDLGNVKIHLSVDGKTLSGHITVATKEALQVFKDNAETLREAFIKNGFENALFDVAFSNNGSFNQNMEFANQQQDNNFAAKRAYLTGQSALDSELEAILSNVEDISNYSVNIVA